MIVLSGPSGAGKSTFINKLLKEENNIYFSISHTTREPREGELEGRDYYFVTKALFLEEIKQKKLLEYAKVHKHYYGTSVKPIIKALNEGKFVLLDIDVQGFINARKFFPDLNSIFISTKNKDELRKRLEKRGEDNKMIDKRLATAQKEMLLIKEYDYLIINEDLEKSYKDFKNIFNTIKFKSSNLNLEEIKNIWNKGE